ncbi:hypothetical protein ZHAS_00019399 [Anopheles sinensis]|uniref:m7GpppN-mRNA hydrolase n=1 Tax=Anopheles sinensis TaxID=74873 RepID=A0A084WM97_ANOSI|nr:hypothetical protein ZHAS_00019399 [Anopheles sinensis]
MATNSPVNAMQPAPATGQKLKKNTSFTISSDILDDLASRFIINVPVEERQNLIRICFQVELAHWFYLDFYCSEMKQKCGIKQFAQQMFKHVPCLQPYCSTVDDVLDNWKQYKVTVPTCGAILLSEDLKHVLLVQSYWAKSSWGFPKGKINENEEPVKCAIREVYEETGYDISNLIGNEYIELVINYQYTRLYLVSGVPLTTVFVPKTRNEIKCCEWFPVDLLPVTKHENIVKDNHQLTGNSFFMILPFVKRLKKWLETHQKGKPGNKGGGKGSNNLQMGNSPVFGRESGGKHKLYYGTNMNAGGSTNKNTYDQQALQQDKSQRQRQRHKSMGELEQPGMPRPKSNSGTPQVNQQQFYKNTPNANQPPQYQILKREDTTLAQKVGFMSIGPSQDVTSAPTEAMGMSKKKQSKSKQEPTPAGGGNVGSGGVSQVGQVERPGKQQIKRKLFANDPYAEFNEISGWVKFKLDYNNFVF